LKICLKIPDGVARYFEKTDRDVEKLSQSLLNDALKSILQLETPVNHEAFDLAE